MGRPSPRPALRDTSSGTCSRYNEFDFRNPPPAFSRNPIVREINPAASNAANARNTERTDTDAIFAKVST
ncbi:hypothetical protein [Arachnia rubra]|uniref:hypothetical protein n=1 Tax=Arachnia rubra TaxID=1547448 RepID=UPI001CC7BA56|nr:hypothetical protein [Arachnia rubra]BCR81688.1 hypothetical protein SK1NUM_21310 [Arachnia rubra]